MILSFSELAWEDYCYWESQDKKTLKRINLLLKDIDRNGYEGIGKPEPLTGDLSGYWSRRIDDFNRIVYKIDGNTVLIAQCGSHYRDKQEKTALSFCRFSYSICLGHRTGILGCSTAEMKVSC